MLSALTKPKHPSARQRNVEESVTPSLQDMLEGSAHSPLDPNMDSADTGDASLEYGEAGDGSVESEPMHKRARIRTSSPVHNEELAKSEKPSKQPRVRRCVTCSRWCKYTTAPVQIRIPGGEHIKRSVGCQDRRGWQSV
jgi:hypothetical protein